MIHKFIRLVVFIWLGAGLLFSLKAQEYALRGVVMDDAYIPVGGVQVSINGSYTVVSTPKEGRFQVNLKSPPTNGELEIVVTATGYKLKSKDFNYYQKEIELIIQPIYKTLGGWVRTPDKSPVSNALVRFRNSTLERNATTDTDGFFKLQLPSEAQVTISDFAVEAYKVDDGNVELRKVKNDNLKFIQENTFVFLTVSADDQIVELASLQDKNTTNTLPASESPTNHASIQKASSPQEPFKITKDNKNLKALIKLIGEKRGDKAITGNHSQVIGKEIETISKELSRLQSEVTRAANDQERTLAEEAFTAYINDEYINSFIESLRKIDPNNPLVILLEKYKRDNQDILDAKNEADRQLSIITSQFRASKFVVVLLLLLVGIAVFFALSNNKKKKKLQEASQTLEEERRRLEVVNEELKTLMGIVAHDLKAPLNKVVGLTQLLPLVGSLNEEQTKCMHMINQVAFDGRQFIENLLDLKAIEEQSRRLKIEPLEVMQWFSRSIIGYEQTAKKKNIELKLESNTSEGYVSVDKSAFGQIVDNLVSNAIKFSPADKNVLISVEVGYSLVSIAVKDEGPGISEEDQQKMFRKFQRLSARPTAGEHSSGLGLSIVKRLVEHMNGEIHLDSRLGEGSTFTVYFHKYVLEAIEEEEPVNQ
ncbi:ATP-binding protein [Cytophagaceae bacterium DM2B3-1]|uniref:histidine kinase n=1 Tax=Xanthocytophaga flava TaxID=3048013 RepID=A0ABT7CD16_9BACT|nr:ATP-binding protein [Xanthocytophaga flavus]MDJ1491591.1 ATP-binding protein [Xanthocytophaga flavus]